VETTLRSGVAIDQAVRARFSGFTIKMIFVATDNVKKNVHRVVLRGLDGGHSAPAERIVEIYLRSLENLPRALAVFDEVALCSRQAAAPGPRLRRATYRVQRAADSALVDAGSGGRLSWP
jgi:predicted ABC-type ATPase